VNLNEFIWTLLGMILILLVNYILLHKKQKALPPKNFKQVNEKESPFI